MIFVRVHAGLDLNGKKCAVFGLGDSISYGGKILGSVMYAMPCSKTLVTCATQKCCRIISRVCCACRLFL